MSFETQYGWLPHFENFAITKNIHGVRIMGMPSGGGFSDVFQVDLRKADGFGLLFFHFVHLWQPRQGFILWIYFLKLKTCVLLRLYCSSNYFNLQNTKQNTLVDALLYRNCVNFQLNLHNLSMVVKELFFNLGVNYIYLCSQYLSFKKRIKFAIAMMSNFNHILKC